MKKEATITPKRFFLLAVLLYVILFFFYYPPFYTTLDEANYIRGSSLLQGGGVGIEDPLQGYGFIFNGQSYVPISFGMPLLLAPFTILGWKAAFLSGMLFHLASVFLFYKLLLKNGEEPDNALLFLFFPYFVYYSTTLYPDLFAAFFILAGFYLYISEKSTHHIASGMLFGMAMTIRYTNVLAFMPFVLVSLFKNRSRLKSLIYGFIPFVFLVLVLNQAYYGGIFKTGYAIARLEGSYGATFIESMVPIGSFTLSLERYMNYIPSISFRLLVVYPLMLLAPLFYKREGRGEILLVLLTFFLFFGSKSQTGGGFNLDPSTLTRYFLPVIPLLLLTYIPFYETALKRLNLPRTAVLYGTVLILVLGGIFILNIQKERLDIQATVSEGIYVNTEPGALLIGEDDVVRYIMEPFGDRRFLSSGTQNISNHFDDKTYIVHKRFETMGAIEEEQARWTQKVIEQSGAILIKEIEYRTATKFFASRPFILEIYKVPHT